MLRYWSYLKYTNLNKHTPYLIINADLEMHMEYTLTCGTTLRNTLTYTLMSRGCQLLHRNRYLQNYMVTTMNKSGDCPSYSEHARHNTKTMPNTQQQSVSIRRTRSILCTRRNLTCLKAGNLRSTCMADDRCNCALVPLP